MSLDEQYIKTDPILPKEPEHQLRGFGGWLILIAIYYFLTTYNSFVYWTDSFIPLYTDGTLAAAIDSSPMLGLIIFLEALVNLFYIVFMPTLAFLCYKQKKKFKSLSILFFSLNPIIIMIYYFAASLTSDYDISDWQGQIMKTILAAVVWIPYFVKSVRVKNTFIY